VALRSGDGRREPSHPADLVEFGNGSRSGRRRQWLGTILLVCLVAATVAVVARPGMHHPPAPTPIQAPAAQFKDTHTLVWSATSPWCGRRIALGCS
jgi:hypothetical protein